MGSKSADDKSSNIMNRVSLRFKESVSVLVILSFFLILPKAYSQKLTIAYTGDSYSALYPCQSCPYSVGGGISRRATAIKKLKSEQDNVIVIDSGNFIGGGFFDSKSINPDMDKKRSLFYCNAMDKIGYDVVAVGENEFIHGESFLKNIINSSSFKLVSSNMVFEGVMPYYIKEVGALKVGVVALSPQVIYKRFGVDIGQYEDALREVIEEIKDKSEFIVLLSSIESSENIRLAKKFPKIKIVISSRPALNNSGTQVIEGTIFLGAYYQGKELGVLDLNIEDGKILDWDFKNISLAMDVEEDLEIKSVIPACFDDRDCQAREGLVSKCENPGEISALCGYYEAEKIDAVLITDEKCAFCSVDTPKKNLKDNFVGIQYKTLHYEDEEAKSILKKYDAETLPIFLIDSALENEKRFKDYEQLFEKRKDKLLLKKEFSGIFMFLNRKGIKDRIDLFLDFCGIESSAIIENLIKFSEEENSDFAIHFIISPDKDYDYCEEETKIALAVKDVYPDKFFEYVHLRSQNIKKISWINTLDEMGMDYNRIKKVFKSKNMEKILKKNSILAEELGINQGNVLLINNNRIFSVYGLKLEELKMLYNQD